MTRRTGGQNDLWIALIETGVGVGLFGYGVSYLGPNDTRVRQYGQVVENDRVVSLFRCSGRGYDSGFFAFRTELEKTAGLTREDASRKVRDRFVNT